MKKIAVFWCLLLCGLNVQNYCNAQQYFYELEYFDDIQWRDPQGCRSVAVEILGNTYWGNSTFTKEGFPRWGHLGQDIVLPQEGGASVTTGGYSPGQGSNTGFFHVAKMGGDLGCVYAGNICRIYPYPIANIDIDRSNKTGCNGTPIFIAFDEEFQPSLLVEIEIRVEGNPNKYLLRKIAGSNGVNVSYSEVRSLIGAEIEGRELRFRIKQPHGDDNYSRDLTGCMFVNIPDFEFKPVNPLCNNGTGSFIIKPKDNSAFKPSDYILTVERYSTDSISGVDPILIPSVTGDPYYLDDAFTISSRLTSSYVDSFVVNNSTLDRQIIGSGMHIIELSPNTVNIEGACSRESYAIFTPPSSIKISNLQAVKVHNSDNHIATNGGTGEATMTITGREDNYNKYSLVGLPDSSFSRIDTNNYRVSGLTAGTHDIKVEDANNCKSDTVSVTLIQPGTLSISATSTNVSCNGGSDGTLTYSISGGIAPYTVTLHTPNNMNTAIKTNSHESETGSFPNLGIGEYKIKVKDVAGVEKQLTNPLSIYQPAALRLNVSVADYIPWPGGSGKVNFSATGGTTPYTYKLGENVIESPYTIADGIYNFSVEDGKGCSASSGVSLSDPSELTIENIVNEVNPICNGDGGAISFNLAGGNSSRFIYKIDLLNSGGSVVRTTETVLGAFSKITFSGLSAGDYRLKAYVKGNPAYYVQSGVIHLESSNPLEAINFDLQTMIKESCAGKSDASISLKQLDLIEGNYYSSVSNGGSFNQVTGVVSGLSAGSEYVVTISETASTRACELFLTIPGNTIEIVDNPLSFNEINKQLLLPSCEYAFNGTISYPASGGFEVVSYSITGDELPAEYETINTTGIFPTLPVGIYVINATDSKGCNISSGDIELEAQENPISDFELLAVNQSCEGVDNGRIHITGLGHSNNMLRDLFMNGELMGSISPGQADFIITDLAAGEYRILVQDENGCYKESSILVSNNHNSPVIDIQTVEKLACQSAINGELMITASTDYPASLLGFSFQQNGVVNEGVKISESEVNNLLTATYKYDNLGDNLFTIAVADELNCRSEISAIIEVDDANVVKLVVSDEDIKRTSCAEVSDGHINASVTNGYAFSDDNFVFSISGNNYSDEQRGTAVIFESLTASDIVYTVTVSDRHGCKDSSDIRLSVKDSPFEILSVNVSHITCEDANDGIIEFEAADWDVNQLYKYTLTDVEQNFELSGDMSECKLDSLSEGLYNLSIVSPSECVSSYNNISVINPKPIDVELFVGKVTDFNTETAVVGVLVANGSGTYDYELIMHDGDTITGQSNETFFEIEGLGAGNYTFRLKDVNNCIYFTDQNNNPTFWYNESFAVVQPESELMLTLASKKDITCFEQKDGQIAVNATGGWLYSNYEFRIKREDENWSSKTFNGLFIIEEPGNYFVEVADNEGVTRQIDLFINEPELFYLSTPVVVNATCFESENGSVNVLHNNGVHHDNGIHYLLRNSDQQVIDDGFYNEFYYNDNLIRGHYSIEAEDKNGCISSADFYVDSPNPIEVVGTNNYIRVKETNTGEIILTVSEGSGVYEYKCYKNNEETPYLNDVNNDGVIILSDLFAGNYKIEVKDVENCYYGGDEWIVKEFSIIEPDEFLSLTIEYNNVSCNGYKDGEIEISGVGGWGDYEFSFNGGEYLQTNTFPELDAGTYSLSVRDKEGVEYSTDFFIEEPDVITADLITTDHVLCFGENTGALHMAIDGGNGSYSVSANNIDFQHGEVLRSLPAGSYYVYVNDAKGCETQTGPFVINENDDVVEQLILIGESECLSNEGYINIVFSGDTDEYTYLWARGSFEQDGSYSYNELPNYNSSNLSNLFSGRYFLTLIDENSCNHNFMYDVVDDTDLEIAEVLTQAVTCFGDGDGKALARVINGEPAYNYLWPENKGAESSPQASGFHPGEYSLLVGDRKGCYTSAKFSISSPDPLSYQVAELNHPICLGGRMGNIDINVIGGTPDYSYEWTNGSNHKYINNVDVGEYSLTVTDRNNCIETFSFVMEYDRVVKPDLGEDLQICHYSELQLDAGSFDVYSWKGENGIVSEERLLTVSNPGEYYLKVTDHDNCTGYDTVSVDISYLKIDEFASKDVTCHGFSDGEASITVNQTERPYSVAWSNDANTNSINGLSGGSYSVVVNDDFGCEDQKTFNIGEPDQLSLRSWATDPTCYGIANGKITVEGMGGKGRYSYNWNGGQLSPTLSKLDKGEYVLELSDENQCSFSAEFILDYQKTLNPVLGGEIVLCAGNSVKLYPGAFSNYKWIVDNKVVARDSALVVKNNMQLTVEVSDSDGCVGIDNVEISEAEFPFEPAFLAASSIARGDTLLLVEVSQPKPAAWSWDISLPHKIVENSNNITKVVFEDPGVGEVKLIADNGHCVGESWKSILVTEDVGDDEKEGEFNSYDQTNFITFLASPNPAQQHFYASIKLKEAAPVTLYLVNISTGQIMEQRTVHGLSEYNEMFSSTTTNHYALFAESKGERRVVKVIVF